MVDFMTRLQASATFGVKSRTQRDGFSLRDDSSTRPLWSAFFLEAGGRSGSAWSVPDPVGRRQFADVKERVAVFA
jgi:hypothetical protein